MRKDQPATIPETGGAGLAGMAMLGAAGCGGEDRGQGGTLLTLTFGPDESGGLRPLIDGFNKENKGEIRVQWRGAPALSDEYFDQIRTELQSGSANMDVIAGDVIWPAQLAAAGYILDLSDRFTLDMRSKYLEAP